MREVNPSIEIAALGSSPSGVRSLLLLPLAYVAAASRRRDFHALEILLGCGARAANIDADGVDRAREWLRYPPLPEQFRAGFERLSREALDTDSPLVTIAEVLEAVVWACNAAQLDRERTRDGYTLVSTSARRAICELEMLLGVEIGDLWSDVMAELGDDLPRSRNFVPPNFETLPDSGRRTSASTAVPTSTALDDSLAAAPVVTRAPEPPAPPSAPFPLVVRRVRRAAPRAEPRSGERWRAALCLGRGDAGWAQCRASQS
jgi:hypothetical protein